MELLHGPSVEAATCFNRVIDFVIEVPPTINVADAASPLPASMEETPPLVFVYDPSLADVTLTVTVQLPSAGMVPPLKLRLFPLAGAVTVPPVQVVPASGTAVFCKPSGYESEKARPLRASVGLGFVILNVSVDIVSSRIESGEKASVMRGGFKLGAGIAITDAVALPVEEVFMPPLAEET